MRGEKTLTEKQQHLEAAVYNWEQGKKELERLHEVMKAAAVEVFVEKYGVNVGDFVQIMDRDKSREVYLTGKIKELRVDFIGVHIILELFTKNGFPGKQKQNLWPSHYRDSIKKINPPQWT